MREREIEKDKRAFKGTEKLKERKESKKKSRIRMKR